MRRRRTHCSFSRPASARKTVAARRSQSRNRLAKAALRPRGARGKDARSGPAQYQCDYRRGTTTKSTCGYLNFAGDASGSAFFCASARKREPPQRSLSHPPARACSRIVRMSMNNSKDSITNHCRSLIWTMVPSATAVVRAEHPVLPRRSPYTCPLLAPRILRQRTF